MKNHWDGRADVMVKRADGWYVLCPWDGEWTGPFEKHGSNMADPGSAWAQLRSYACKMSEHLDNETEL